MYAEVTVVCVVVMTVVGAMHSEVTIMSTLVGSDMC